MREQHDNKWQLWLGTIGVVYGDIGTSPLYTMRECFTAYELGFNEQNILGVTSLILWSLFIIVTLKYVIFVIQADNHGEGGILALSTLTLKIKKLPFPSFFLGAALLGTSLFYGDGVITPAISVLGALEGLKVYSPYLTQDLIVMLSCVIIFALFFFQHRGTHSIGRWFGPITTVWFIVISVMGLVQIFHTPTILKAINPYYAVDFFIQAKAQALLSLASVFLAVTGAEALYADLGHFSKTSVRQTWCYFIFPALILNYLGQGGILLENPASLENPFFHLVPVWAVLPLVVLAALATIVASQAVISGIFSLSWQAIQLGYLPRMRVIHTSSHQRGHVYIPTMNYIIMLLTLIVVGIFKTSDNLASAYGVTVNGIMLMTSLLLGVVAYYVWEWRLWKVIGLVGSFIFIDLLFLSVNLLKIIEGGWIPLLIACGVLIAMRTWIKGRRILAKEVKKSSISVEEFLENIKKYPPVRIPGAAIYMSSTPGAIPSSLSVNLTHYRSLHEYVIVLSILIKEVPRLLAKDRISFQHLGNNIYEVQASYGYMEVPNLNFIFEKIRELGLDIEISESSFILARGIPIPSVSPGLNSFEEKIFIFLTRNAISPVDFYKIPYTRVIELGVRFRV